MSDIQHEWTKNGVLCECSPSRLSNRGVNLTYANYASRGQYLSCSLNYVGKQIKEPKKARFSPRCTRVYIPIMCVDKYNVRRASQSKKGRWLIKLN